MITLLRRATAMLALCGAGLVGAVTVVAVTHSEVEAAKPPCHGPVVNVRYGATLRCDVRPPQRLNVTNVPTKARCDDMGGVYVGRTCKRVDY